MGDQALRAKQIGNRIRVLRRGAGLSMAELSAAVGRTNQWLSFVERGKLLPKDPAPILEAIHRLRIVREAADRIFAQTVEQLRKELGFPQRRKRMSGKAKRLRTQESRRRGLSPLG